MTSSIHTVKPLQDSLAGASGNLLLGWGWDFLPGSDLSPGALSERVDLAQGLCESIPGPAW